MTNYRWLLTPSSGSKISSIGFPKAAAILAGLRAGERISSWRRWAGCIPIWYISLLKTLQIQAYAEPRSRDQLPSGQRSFRKSLVVEFTVI
jgi:hypothetical protein